MAQEKIPGILGGMGPEATIDLFAKIVRSTKASQDQEHLRIIIDNNPMIPDRQDAILKGGTSPSAQLIATARNLERSGADFIVMPCNTAHYWIQEIRSAIRIPIVDMVKETAEEVARLYPSIRSVGILAATGTLKAGLYQKHLVRFETACLAPSVSDQAVLMQLIYTVKSGDTCKPKAAMQEIGRKLVEAGAGVVIAGCTEIPLILKTGDLSVPIVDATQVLATRIVALAQGLVS